MLSVEQAQAEILGRVRALPTERVDVLASLGRVLAEPIRSTRRIPPWPNSSMDGYAVRAADARPSATLRVVDRVIAGSLPTRAVGAGEAVRIFTGAPLPDGADAVVPQEDVDARDGVIALRGTVVPGAFVRPAGEDVREGDLVLEPGRPIGAAEIGILATLGRTQVTVGRRPRVAVLSTGNELADLGRDLPLSQVPLQPLSQAETLQLVQAIAGVGTESPRNGGERREHGPDQPSAAGTSPAAELETKLSALGDVLFAQTDGQPLYLLETLKLLRDRQWLVPRVDADGPWRLELTVEMATIVAQEQSQGALLPPSVRALILARLAPLSQAARQLVQVNAVLGTAASAQRLWQLAEMGVQAGVEALEEAIGSGILREEEAGGPGAGSLGSYRFSPDLIRDVVYTELGAARRQVLHQRALVLLQTEGTAAAELAYHARASGETEAAYGYSVQAGMEAVAVFAVADAIGHYEQARALLQEHQWIQSRLATSEVERLYVHLGQAYVFQNNWEQAQDAYEELLAYAQQKPLPALVSMTLNRLAILAVQQTFDKPKVQALLDEAWQMAQTSHDQRALAETEWNLAQITSLAWDDPKSALVHGERALSLARGIQDTELEARSLSSLGSIHIRGGGFEQAVHCDEASLALYARLHSEPTASPELSLPHFLLGAPPTQSLTNRASEALCWVLLAFAHVNGGQVLGSLRSGRRALALSQEIKNVW